MHRFAFLIAAAFLLLAAPAYADRAGDGPVRAPRILDSIHTEFTLPGSGWAQVVGALAGTPRLGDYAVDRTLPSGGSCRIETAVDSRLQGIYPSVGKRIVKVNPWVRVPVRYTRSGHQRGVRWWVGTSQGLDAAAIAVRRTPAKLSSKHRRYTVTHVSVSHTAAPADDAACAELARTVGTRTALRIVRTLALADGPAVAEEPFTPA